MRRVRLHRPRRHQHGDVTALRLAVERHRRHSVRTGVGWRWPLHGHVVGAGHPNCGVSDGLVDGGLPSRQRQRTDWVRKRQYLDTESRRRGSGLHRLPSGCAKLPQSAPVSTAVSTVAAAVSAALSAATFFATSFERHRHHNRRALRHGARRSHRKRPSSLLVRQPLQVW